MQKSRWTWKAYGKNEPQKISVKSCKSLWKKFTAKDLKAIATGKIGRVHDRVLLVDDVDPSAYKNFIRHLKLQGRTIEDRDAMMHWSWYHAGWGAHRRMMKISGKDSKIGKGLHVRR